MANLNDIGSSTSKQASVSKKRSFANFDPEALKLIADPQVKVKEVAPAPVSALEERQVSQPVVETEPSSNEGQIIQIHVDSIIPHEHQSRVTFDLIALEELSRSIKSNGVRTPLRVIKKGAKFEVASGERRLRAAKMAGISHVPCIIIEERQGLIDSVLENLVREDLDILEEGRDYHKLMENGVYPDQKGMSDGLGVSMSRISEALKFYREIPMDMQTKLRKEGRVTRRELRNFLKYKDSSPIEKRPSFDLVISFKDDEPVCKMNNVELLTANQKQNLLNKLRDLISALN